MAGFLILNEVFNSADVSGENGATACHGLEDGVGHAVPESGVDDEGGLVVEVSESFYIAFVRQHDDSRGGFAVAQRPAPVVGLGSSSKTAHDGETPVAAEFFQGVEEETTPLFQSHFTAKQESPGYELARLGVELVTIDGVGDEFNVASPPYETGLVNEFSADSHHPSGPLQGPPERGRLPLMIDGSVDVVAAQTKK